MDAHAVVEHQAGVERVALEVGDGVNVHGAAFGVGEDLLHTVVEFEVDDGHVRLHGGPVQRGRGGFASLLAGLVPGRGADGKALRGAHDGVEGVQGWAGDECGLILDP